MMYSSGEKVIPSYEKFLLLASPEQVIQVTAYKSALGQIDYRLVDFSYKESSSDIGAYDLALTFKNLEGEVFTKPFRVC